MLGTTHPIAQHHIPEELNPQQHCCENLNLTFNILCLASASQIHVCYYIIMGGAEAGTKYILPVGSMTKCTFVNGL